VRRIASALQDPLPSWLAFNVTFVAWHVPAAYDATLHSQLVHALEHLMFFGTALLFWTRVIDSPPWRSPLADLPRAAYVGLAMVVSWVLAIAFAVSTAPVYAPYAAQASRPGGLTALADQQLAAGVMWVPGSIPLAIAILFVVYRWLQPKRSGEPSGSGRLLPGTPD
jgi:putative membrane protein